ncbi:unnamed protein product, partial [marine sediment metagenome]
VMGSKNLKGIAVRGHNPPAMADPKAVSAMAFCPPFKVFLKN